MPYYPQVLDRFWTSTDHGLLAQTYEGSLASDTATVSTAGRLELSRLKLPYPASVTNIVMKISTAGGTLTSGQCFAALFTSAGVKVGVTATQHTAWESAGIKTMALASGPFAVNAGDYYVGFWYNGTTGPTFARQGANNSATCANIGRSASDYIACTSNTGLTTTCPDPFTTLAIVSGSFWWMGLS